MTTPDTETNKHRHYDVPTLALHWITAGLVLALCGTAMAWLYLPGDWGLRWLQPIHVSLGIALAVTILGRLAWRLVVGRRLSPPPHRLTRVLSKIVHLSLYALLLLQVGLGFSLQWLGGEVLSFFGLFEIPSPVSEDRDLGRQFESLHLVVAWALMILASGHAAAALAHHYLLKDGVLRRMVPFLH